MSRAVGVLSRNESGRNVRHAEALKEAPAHLLHDQVASEAIRCLDDNHSYAIRRNALEPNGQMSSLLNRENIGGAKLEGA